MHEFHLFSPVNVSLGRSELFNIALSSAALLGVGWRGESSSCKFYLPSGAACLWPGIFSFTSLVVRHLGNFLFLYSQPCLVCTVSWGIRYILEGPFGCFICQIVLKGGLKWSVEIECDICVNCPLRILTDHIYVISLVSGFPSTFGRYCMVAFYGVILFPWFPSDTKGSEVFWGTALRLRLMSLGVSSLPPGIVAHWWIKSHREILPSLLQDIFALFPRII